MKLSVYSLEKILFQGDAASINCTTEAGEITVLDHHRPLIGVLAGGVMRVADSQKKDHFFEIKSGFIEVRNNNEVRCLVN